MLYNYELNNPPPPRELLLTLERLEQEAGIEHSFSHGSSLKEDEMPYRGNPTRMIYVIGWAHAGEAGSYEEVPDSWKEKMPTTCRDPKAFGIELVGDSMEPKFSEGDWLVVQPSEPPHSGCYVVARYANDGVIFRRYEMAGDTITLVPLNPRYEASQHSIEEFSWIYPVYGRWSLVWRK